MIIQDFFDGRTFDAYEFFGAHIEGDEVVFRTYAPNAVKVSIFGEFNSWQEEEMEELGESGIYCFRSKKARPGMMYKYRIYKQDEKFMDHCDPYGFGMELRPNTASYIVDLTEYQFTDDEWMANRSTNMDEPLNIYEMHLGSWKTNDADENGWFRYNEIADDLIAYVKENHYTHIEFMPLSEHPADCSWGYQNTGFFSPTSRYGTAKELKELVDKCHQAGIGVIIDFVPVHFAVDDYGLNMYDGTALYEFPHSDMADSEWGTRNFMHSRGEVCSFLQSAANYWLKEFHFDGIRMDAISRAIYWQGDPNRGVNTKAIEFIQNMNQGLKQLHPTAMLIAEDSTAYPKVTAPVEHGGLGFDYKWDLGWMNDTLHYFSRSPEERPAEYHKLTFSMHYFYNERFLLPLSHDEVVHGKGTIIQKMWGEYEDKFRQLRALYLYMYTHPGKKLNFMGNEIAHFREWDEKREQDWNLLEFPMHDAFHRYMKKLGELYISVRALYESPYDYHAFHWLVGNDQQQCVYIFERGIGIERIVAAFNFSNHHYKNYRFSTSVPMQLKELMNSDFDLYGGSVPYQLMEFAESDSFEIDLPPLSGRLFKGDVVSLAI
ncbi:1,4-alpha-glucan branching protein GlgB [Bacillus sp. AGMB 02131]|uniref:1,4-alpha-glucan branching enzyme n=1 Tax=Peribacillus faecalis TaxID=2772559 RepID=A0A927HDY0_9BACI|nr:1,4-alpha-glucan branching protein GlgB [Peribacillus faecalis]MBD3109943.1 1,4-alpha-glucan branching protein GlgB [Peribacillus faecalis]